MNHELTSRLFADFPELFTDRKLFPQETLLKWGLACGNGWYDLVRALCEVIVAHQAEVPDAPITHVMQVKEKLGGLRFYYRGGDEYVRGAVGLAARLSYQICEECGRPASASSTAAGGTRCSEHLDTIKHD